MQAATEEIRAGVDAFNKEMEARGSKIRAHYPLEITFHNMKRTDEQPFVSAEFCCIGAVDRPDMWVNVVS